jgi:hypothetical protein
MIRILKDKDQTTWIATCNTRNRACFLGLEDLIFSTFHQGKVQKIKQKIF